MINFLKGENLYDTFVIPTIRINKTNVEDDIYITAEWLKWYIGIRINIEEKK